MTKMRLAIMSVIISALAALVVALFVMPFVPDRYFQTAKWGCVLVWVLTDALLVVIFHGRGTDTRARKNKETPHAH